MNDVSSDKKAETIREKANVTVRENRFDLQCSTYEKGRPEYLLVVSLKTVKTYYF